jgi:hypothetical protein
MVEDRPRRPQRVRVSSPRTSASAARPRGGAQEIDAQTHLGEVYMRSLLRTQLRLALTALALVVGPLAALPLIFVLVPRVATVSVLGLPLPWLLLGVVVHPVLVFVGWAYARRAAQAEQQFADLVLRS